MADITLVKISALPAAEQIGAEDLLPVVQEGATKAASYGIIKDDIAAELAPDATLSEAGKAADAKAAGDALATKVNIVTYNAEVSRINDALASKADNMAFNDAVDAINEELDTKASTAYVESVIGRMLLLSGDSATTITAGDDLNNYQTPGNFRITNYANANAVANMPVTSAGRLIVLTTSSTVYIMQLYIANISPGYDIYMRSKNGTSAEFVPWQKITKSADIADIMRTIAEDGTQWA